jgi:hypothetical protein
MRYIPGLEEYLGRLKSCICTQIRSDAICNRYKVDLTLQQSGVNFLADLSSVLIAPIGSVAGGATGTSFGARHVAARRVGGPPSTPVQTCSGSALRGLSDRKGNGTANHAEHAKDGGASQAKDDVFNG